MVFFLVILIVLEKGNARIIEIDSSGRICKSNIKIVGIVGYTIHGLVIWTEMK